MVGVGVFTSGGYMLAALKSPSAVLLAWVVGGVAAISGALCYAELGAAFPRNGGEYQLLSRIYHPAIGFIAGWVALFVGFSAPLALYGHVFGKYLSELIPQLNPLATGIALILFFATLHSLHVWGGTGLHNVITVGKIALIAAFAMAALFHGEPRLLTEGDTPIGPAVFQSSFAVQLVYVSFAYSGWNAAAYLLGEFKHPQRDVPRVVLIGTLIVMALYVALNAAFLTAAPAAEIAGKEDVARIAAASLFGPVGGRLVTALIAGGLLSTASANLISGPRVYEAVGREYEALRFLTLRRAGGGPIFAIALQALAAIGLLVSASFETLSSYIGITLALSSTATVGGLFVLRIREPATPRPYRTWGYPFTPLVFLALEWWMIAYTLKERPTAAAWTAVTLTSGLLVYFLVRRAASGRQAG